MTDNKRILAASPACERTTALFGLLALTTLMATSTGCGSSDQLPLNTVEGTVLFRGQPAVGAFVVFHPENPSEEMRKLRPAATTGAEGKFKLSTYGPNDGIPAGDYRVTVIWRGAPKGGSESHGTDRLMGRYSNSQTTPLKMSVNPDDPQPASFDLQ